MRRKKKKRYKREQRCYYFASSIHVERVCTGDYGGRGKKRAKKQKATEEQITRWNQYRREKNLERILEENFNENDYWTLLTYRRGYRTNIKSAKKDFSRFIRMLRREWRKRGHELKWVLRTDIGEKGAAHHHLLVGRIPDGDIIIKECWQKIEGTGFHSFTPIYAEGGFAGLAHYIAKPPEKEGIERNYSRSRNLHVPEPEITRALKRDMQNPPEPLPGYYIDEDSVVMGINPVTGYEYQYFTMIKLERKSTKRQVAPVQRPKGGDR